MSEFDSRDKDPAEGSREIIDRELERQKGRGAGKDDKATPQKHEAEKKEHHGG